VAESFSWPSLSRDAQTDLDGVREQAQQQGYEAGYASGHAAALAEQETQRQALNESLNALAARDRTLGAEDQAALLELVRHLIRALLAVELRTNGKVLEQLIADGMQALNAERGELLLKVAEVDLAWVAVDGVEVAVEEGRQPGCLSLETGRAAIEFDPAARLDGLLAAIHDASES
jgi:flagellar assembly protein FliH